MAGVVFVLTLVLLLGLTVTVDTDNYSTGYTTEQEDGSFTIELATPESDNGSYFNYKDSCPTWFHRNQSGECVCGSPLHDRIRCDQSQNQTSLLNCYSMTLSNVKGRQQTVVGGSIYSCFNRASYTSKDNDYRVLPRNVSMLNRIMCKDLHREGLLCGNCQKNYFLAPYTYDIRCFTCDYSHYNWIWYVAVAYGPLTVFFIVMVSCRISVISGKLNAFVNFSQGLTSSANLRVILAALESNGKYVASQWLVKILASLLSVWNLDFFRTLVYPICLNVTTLQALALDYGIAVYPLILIGMTYVLIELHEHNFRVVVFAWKPFHKCFARMRNSWDMKTSIIDAFATFLFLSYIKILSVSSAILLYTQLYNVHGRPVSKRLYYNASVEYLGTEHLPYAITAIAVLVVFVLVPLILLVMYPLRIFQRCLDYCHLRTRMLTTFVDSFQGCYKDGTDGTRDCRYFSTVYIVFRIVSTAAYAITLDVYLYSLASLMLVIIAILFFVFQPYKKLLYNYVDVILCLNFAMVTISITALSVATAKQPSFIELSMCLAIIFSTAPLVYIKVIVWHWIIVKKRIPQRLLLSMTRSLQGPNPENYEQSEDSFPHRILFPEQYSQVALLPPHMGPGNEETSVEEAAEDFVGEQASDDLWSVTQNSSSSEDSDRDLGQTP